MEGSGLALQHWFPLASCLVATDTRARTCLTDLMQEFCSVWPEAFSVALQDLTPYAVRLTRPGRAGTRAR